MMSPKHAVEAFKEELFSKVDDESRYFEIELPAYLKTTTLMRFCPNLHTGAIGASNLVYDEVMFSSSVFCIYIDDDIYISVQKDEFIEFISGQLKFLCTTSY